MAGTNALWYNAVIAWCYTPPARWGFLFYVGNPRNYVKEYIYVKTCSIQKRQNVINQISSDSKLSVLTEGSEKQFLCWPDETNIHPGSFQMPWRHFTNLSAILTSRCTNKTTDKPWRRAQHALTLILFHRFHFVSEIQEYSAHIQVLVDGDLFAPLQQGIQLLVLLVQLPNGDPGVHLLLAQLLQRLLVVLLTHAGAALPALDLAWQDLIDTPAHK